VSISSHDDALSGKTWRTVLQSFRTKTFLTQIDVFSAKTASELCGKKDRQVLQLRGFLASLSRKAVILSEAKNLH